MIVTAPLCDRYCLTGATVDLCSLEASGTSCTKKRCQSFTPNRGPTFEQKARMACQKVRIGEDSRARQCPALQWLQEQTALLGNCRTDVSRCNAESCSARLSGMIWIGRRFSTVCRAVRLHVRAFEVNVGRAWLAALTKPNGGVREIATGCTIRRIPVRVVHPSGHRLCRTLAPGSHARTTTSCAQQCWRGSLPYQPHVRCCHLCGCHALNSVL